MLDKFYDLDAVWHARTDERDNGVYEGRERRTPALTAILRNAS